MPEREEATHRRGAAIRTNLTSVGAMLVALAGCGGGGGEDAGGDPGMDSGRPDALAIAELDAARDATATEDGFVVPDAFVGDDAPLEPDAPRTDLALHGYAQKGPFLPGSRVTIIGLDERLYPTGDTFLSETYGPLGEYDAGSLAPGLYQVEVSGRTRAESGSGPEITLRAIAAADEEGLVTASVTAITHLTTPRIRQLVRDGMDLDDARLQAEAELRVALDVTVDGFDPGPIGTHVWPTPTTIACASRTRMASTPTRTAMATSATSPRWASARQASLRSSTTGACTATRPVVQPRVPWAVRAHTRAGSSRQDPSAPRATRRVVVGRRATSPLAIPARMAPRAWSATAPRSSRASRTSARPTRRSAPARTSVATASTATPA